MPIHVSHVYLRQKSELECGLNQKATIDAEWQKKKFNCSRGVIPNPHDGNLWHSEHEPGRRRDRPGEDVFQGMRVIRGGRDRGRELVVPLVDVLVNQAVMEESAIKVIIGLALDHLVIW